MIGASDIDRRLGSGTAPHARSTIPVERLFIAISIAFLVVVLVRTAWIADEAAIELRVVENVVSGHGLRWNVGERVQAFTDPLWVMLVSAADVFVRQPYVAVWTASFALTIAAVVAVAFGIAADATAALMAITMLTFSRSFVEYSVSGFQTPLAVTLLAAFWMVFWRMAAAKRQITVLTALTALCALTDLLVAVVMLPGLIVASKRADIRTRTQAVAIGLVPVAAWLLFAVIYYGFVLPNPVTAAWHAPWSIKDMARQGGLYVLDCVNGDPLAVVAIAAAVAAVGFGLIPEGGPLVVGVLAFLAVLVASGGDALSGRSLVAPFASAVMLLARYPWGQLREAVVLPLGAVLALGMVSPAAPVWSDADFGKNAPSWERWRGEPAPPPTVINHIRDERRLWYQTTGLLKAQRYVPLPDTSRAEATVSQAVTERRHVVDADTIGLLGVVAGSRLHVVDPLARTDAFLARLPASEAWRPGGVTRALPSGYAETIETGENRIADPKLAAYFDTISIVTRGPLFSRARLRALIAANLGR